MLVNNRQPPITLWNEMKEKLRKNIFLSHTNISWTNGTNRPNNKPGEYIAKLDEYMMHCQMNEDVIPTLSRSRLVPHEDLQRKLYVCNVTTLEHA